MGGCRAVGGLGLVLAMVTAAAGCAAPGSEPEVVGSEQALTAGSGCFNPDRGASLGLGDNASRLRSLPFAVDFYGVSYMNLWINSNGNITFDGANTSTASTTVPDGPRILVAPLYGDLNPAFSRGSDVFLNVVGAAPNRQVLVTWYIVPEAGSSVPNTFQVQFHEADGAIIFTYETIGTDGINPDLTPMSIGLSSGTGQHTEIATGSAIPAFEGAATRFDWDGSDYSAYDGCAAPPANSAPTANAGADQVLECDGGGAALATLDGSASSDPEDDLLNYAWSEAGDELATGESADVSFTLGLHQVDLSVDDGEFSAADSLTVLVEDNGAPSIDMTVGETDIWPPNRRMHTVLTGVGASDSCCDTAVSIHVDGGDANDHSIIDNGDGTFDVRVRAERSGREWLRGRTYTITIDAVDCAGNESSETVEVHVAHDLGKHRCGWFGHGHGHGHGHGWGWSGWRFR